MVTPIIVLDALNDDQLDLTNSSPDIDGDNRQITNRKQKFDFEVDIEGGTIDLDSIVQAGNAHSGDYCLAVLGKSGQQSVWKKACALNATGTAVDLRMWWKWAAGIGGYYAVTHVLNDNTDGVRIALINANVGGALMEVNTGSGNFTTHSSGGGDNMYTWHAIRLVMNFSAKTMDIYREDGVGGWTLVQAGANMLGGASCTALRGIWLRNGAAGTGGIYWDDIEVVGVDFARGDVLVEFSTVTADKTLNYFAAFAVDAAVNPSGSEWVYKVTADGGTNYQTISAANLGKLIAASNTGTGLGARIEFKQKTSTAELKLNQVVVIGGY